MDVDLDDTHLCIKCNATIVGIDAYVEHRRRNCTAKADQISGQLVSNEHHAYATFEYAEDETTPKQETPKPYTLPFANDPPKSHNPSTHSIATSVVLHDPSRVENYDCELGADIFFSSLELQSSSKTRQSVLSTPARPTASRSRARKTTASSHDVDHDEWIDEAPPVDGSAQLMKAVRDISGTRKSDPLFDMIRLSQDSPFSFGDEDEEDDEDPIDDDHPSDEEHVPPPSYTKGKWVPGTKIVQLDYKTDVNSGQAINEKFRCRVCDRSLCNGAAYAKHLKSELHIKRSLPEHELDLGSRPAVNAAETKLRLSRTLREMPASKCSSPQFVPPLPAETAHKTRLRRHIYIKCEICKSRLAKHLHGKHLISQFHYRRMCKLDRPYDHLLNYMPAIVKQCPFQCHPCRFYANTEAHFMRHWISPEHRQLSETSAKGPFWCSFCKFQCETNAEMGTHLTGTQHQELIQALDRSVPIIIRKMSPIICTKCQATFQFNAQLRDHTRLCMAGEPSLLLASTSASDEYQSKFRCNLCPVVLLSRKAIHMHRASVHLLKTYFCSICDLNFASARKARLHRTSTEHKVKSAHLRQRGDLTRVCRVCGVTLADVVKLREHLSQEHPMDKHSCTHCGARFELQQELSRHIRDKACFKATQAPQKISDNQDRSNKYDCKQCNFSTLSKSEHIFHEILHDYPHPTETPSKMSCPICRKSFFKGSLRMHLRQHTDERPFECKRCDVSFARKSNLRTHIRQKHSGKPQIHRSTNVAPDNRTNKSRHLLQPHFHCHRSQVTVDTSSADTIPAAAASATRTIPEATSPTTTTPTTTIPTPSTNASSISSRRNGTSTESCPCASSANDNDCLLDDGGRLDDGDGDECGAIDGGADAHPVLLARHSSDRNDKAFVCDVQACNYRGRTKKLLNRHLKMHATTEDPALIKSHRCSQCNFNSRFPGHLKRHLLVHSGEKPYKCPHCDYSCNNSENLRKHVLSTRLHPGRSLYECHKCDPGTMFTSNYLKEYKEHVVRVHSAGEDENH